MEVSFRGKTNGEDPVTAIACSSNNTEAVIGFIDLDAENGDFEEENILIWFWSLLLT